VRPPVPAASQLCCLRRRDHRFEGIAHRATDHAPLPPLPTRPSPHLVTGVLTSTTPPRRCSATPASLLQGQVRYQAPRNEKNRKIGHGQICPEIRQGPSELVTEWRWRGLGCVPSGQTPLRLRFAQLQAVAARPTTHPVHPWLAPCGRAVGLKPRGDPAILQADPAYRPAAGKSLQSRDSVSNASLETKTAALGQRLAPLRIATSMPGCRKIWPPRRTRARPGFYSAA